MSMLVYKLEQLHRDIAVIEANNRVRARSAETSATPEFSAQDSAEIAVTGIDKAISTETEQAQVAA